MKHSYEEAKGSEKNLTGLSDFTKEQKAELLHKEIKACDVNEVKQLLKHGVNPNSEYEGKIALLLVAEHSFNNESEEYSNIIKIAEALLDYGASRDLQDAQDNTALICAAIEGNLAMVKLLLRKCADPNLPNKEGNTALMIAAEKGNLAMVKSLREYEADPNLPNKEGNTAFSYAKSSEMVKLLSTNQNQTIVEEVEADPNNDGDNSMDNQANNNPKSQVELAGEGDDGADLD